MGERFEQDLELRVEGKKGCCGWKWCWWNPPQEALVAQFCNESSLHGLQYMGQQRRHISERIFWLIAFLIGLVAAGLLIYAMIDRYEDTPVVVSFQSKEQLIDTIPFPAVTLCNINQFSKKKVLELERIAALPTHKHYKEAKLNLTLVEAFCQSQKSFAQSHNYAFSRGDPNTLDYSNYSENQKHMMDFLVENSVPCDQMIPLCSFGGTSFECSTEFRPVITEFGKCCTFNMMPLPLIFKNPSSQGKKNSSIFNNPALGTMNWDEEEIEVWSKWDYDQGFILPPLNWEDSNSQHEYRLNPIRQHGAGMPFGGKDEDFGDRYIEGSPLLSVAKIFMPTHKGPPFSTVTKIFMSTPFGLSILVDPITDDYYCPMSDSEGILFTLHTPVELPNIKDFPSVLDTNKEAYVKVYPDVTFADPDIRDLNSEQRQCYFGKEKQLKLFAPYTRENCIDDCVAGYIEDECRCGLFHMPRSEGVRVCNADVDSEDGECVKETRHLLRTFVKNLLCGHCLALCEDISYKYETTTVTLQNTTQIWHDRAPWWIKDKLPDWVDHKVSIVHIFFGTPATVPKLRKRLYGVTDLIANAGGILGLCLGFSALSAVELVYFVCVRAAWRYCYQRRLSASQGRRTRYVAEIRGPSIL